MMSQHKMAANWGTIIFSSTGAYEEKFLIDHIFAEIEDTEL